MTNRQQVTIELDKIRMVILLIGSLALLLAGIWMLGQNSEEITAQGKNPVFIHGIAIAAIAFSALATLFLIRRLRDPAPGLTLDAHGFADRSGGLSLGYIPWSEVLDISESRQGMLKFITITVRDPGKYAARGNLLQRWSRLATAKMCGTPVFISTNALKIDAKDLKISIEEYYAAYRAAPETSADNTNEGT